MKLMPKVLISRFKSRKRRAGLSDKTLARLSVVSGSLMLSTPAFAIFENANTTLQNVGQGLIGLAIAVITIAVTVVGYKVLYNGKHISECANIIIGAILIAGSAAIAGGLMV